MTLTQSNIGIFKFVIKEHQSVIAYTQVYISLKMIW